MNSYEEIKKERYKEWITFYRLNTHVFAEHYLGISLKFYQRILLYFMNLVPLIVWVSSRGNAKSFVSGLYACCRAILYPGTQVVLVASTIDQAAEIINVKIKSELMSKSETLSKEILAVKGGKNPEIQFHNGSMIRALAPNDGARGKRSHLTIYDEFRLIDKDIVDKVIKPMKKVLRMPPFRTLPEYSTPEWEEKINSSEENREIFISSAWYKHHWMYETMQTTRLSMQKSLDSNLPLRRMALSLDYFVSIVAGLITKQAVEEDMETMDEATIQMEYKNLMYGESNDAFFKLKDLIDSQTVPNAFYSKDLKWIKKERDRIIPKKKGEIRILAVDIALMGGSDNDATAIIGIRLIPRGEKYLRRISFIETLENQITSKQVIRIKQLFNDFVVDKVVIDANGAGAGIYDGLSVSQYDNDRQVEYEAWTSFNDDKMKARYSEYGALEVMYAMKATADLNSIMHASLRDNIRSGYVELLENERFAEAHLADQGVRKETNIDEFIEKIEPFKQTTALINETVNLSFETMGNRIKLKEKGRNRKDRYSALLYGNYLADILEKENLVSKQMEYNPEKIQLVYF